METFKRGIYISSVCMKKEKKYLRLKMKYIIEKEYYVSEVLLMLKV